MKSVFRKSSTITINGKVYSGSSVSISNGDIYIDGNNQLNISSEPVVNIEIHGDVEELETQSGDVRCRNIGELVTTSGDVSCSDVAGSIRTVSGDVNCANVGGNIKTVSGDVSRG